MDSANKGNSSVIEGGDNSGGKAHGQDGDHGSRTMSAEEYQHFYVRSNIPISNPFDVLPDNVSGDGPMRDAQSPSRVGPSPLFVEIPQTASVPHPRRGNGKSKGRGRGGGRGVRSQGKRRKLRWTPVKSEPLSPLSEASREDEYDWPAPFGSDVVMPGWPVLGSSAVGTVPLSPVDTVGGDSPLQTSQNETVNAPLTVPTRGTVTVQESNVSDILITNVCSLSNDLNVFPTELLHAPVKDENMNVLITTDMNVTTTELVPGNNETVNVCESMNVSESTNVAEPMHVSQPTMNVSESTNVAESMHVSQPTLPSGFSVSDVYVSDLDTPCPELDIPTLQWMPFSRLGRDMPNEYSIDFTHDARFTRVPSIKIPDVALTGLIKGLYAISPSAYSTYGGRYLWQYGNALPNQWLVLRRSSDVHFLVDLVRQQSWSNTWPMGSGMIQNDIERQIFKISDKIAIDGLKFQFVWRTKKEQVGMLEGLLSEEGYTGPAGEKYVCLTDGERGIAGAMLKNSERIDPSEYNEISIPQILVPAWQKVPGWFTLSQMTNYTSLLIEWIMFQIREFAGEIGVQHYILTNIYPKCTFIGDEPITIDANEKKYMENYDLFGYNGLNRQNAIFDKMEFRLDMVIPYPFWKYEKWTDRKLIEIVQDYFRLRKAPSEGWGEPDTYWGDPTISWVFSFLTLEGQPKKYEIPSTSVAGSPVAGPSVAGSPVAGPPPVAVNQIVPSSVSTPPLVHTDLDVHSDEKTFDPQSEESPQVAKAWRGFPTMRPHLGWPLNWDGPVLTEPIRKNGKWTIWSLRPGDLEWANPFANPEDLCPKQILIEKLTDIGLPVVRQTHGPLAKFDMHMWAGMVAAGCVEYRPIRTDLKQWTKCPVSGCMPMRAVKNPGIRDVWSQSEESWDCPPYPHYTYKENGDKMWYNWKPTIVEMISHYEKCHQIAKVYYQCPMCKSKGDSPGRGTGWYKSDTFVKDHLVQYHGVKELARPFTTENYGALCDIPSYQKRGLGPIVREIFTDKLRFSRPPLEYNILCHEKQVLPEDVENETTENFLFSDVTVGQDISIDYDMRKTDPKSIRFLTAAIQKRNDVQQQSRPFLYGKNVSGKRQAPRSSCTTTTKWLRGPDSSRVSIPQTPRVSTQVTPKRTNTIHVGGNEIVVLPSCTTVVQPGNHESSVQSSVPMLVCSPGTQALPPLSPPVLSHTSTYVQSPGNHEIIQSPVMVMPVISTRPPSLYLPPTPTGTPYIPQPQMPPPPMPPIGIMQPPMQMSPMYMPPMHVPPPMHIPPMHIPPMHMPPPMYMSPMHTSPMNLPPVPTRQLTIEPYGAWGAEMGGPTPSVPPGFAPRFGPQHNWPDPSGVTVVTTACVQPISSPALSVSSAQGIPSIVPPAGQAGGDEQMGVCAFGTTGVGNVNLQDQNGVGIVSIRDPIGKLQRGLDAAVGSAQQARDARVGTLDLLTRAQRDCSQLQQTYIDILASKDLRISQLEAESRLSNAKMDSLCAQLKQVQDELKYRQDRGGPSN